MRFLDLFSGIGGFALGLTRAGMQPAMFCEIEPFCQRVLAKHWPGVPIHDDVRSLNRLVVAEKAGPVDLVCGGFPCQDISVAGQGRGLTGERSGLWFEYLRIIEEVAPRWVIIENVPALRTRGLDVVLGGLAALGYDAEWHCIPASAVGAPHRRDRVWIVAHANRSRQHEQAGAGDESWLGVAQCGGDVAHASIPRLPAPERETLLGTGWWDERGAVTDRSGWSVEPDVGRVVDGPAARVDRRKRLIAIGNAVVPQIPELIGRAIMAIERG